MPITNSMSNVYELTNTDLIWTQISASNSEELN